MAKRPGMEELERQFGTVHAASLGEDVTPAEEPEALAPSEPVAAAPVPPVAAPTPAPEHRRPAPVAQHLDESSVLHYTKVALPFGAVSSARAIASRGERRKDLMLSQEVVLGALVCAALELGGVVDVRGLTKYDQEELAARIVRAAEMQSSRAAA